MEEPTQGMEEPAYRMVGSTHGMEEPTQGMAGPIQRMEGPTCHPIARGSKGAETLPSDPAVPVPVPCPSCKPIEHHTPFSPASHQALPLPCPDESHPGAGRSIPGQLNTHMLPSSSIKASDSQRQKDKHFPLQTQLSRCYLYRARAAGMAWSA